MSDKSKLLACVTRARGMKEWAEGENGFFQLMAELESSWLNAMFDTDVRDTDAREAIYHRIMAGRDIVRALQDTINKGKPAEAELDRLRAIETGEKRPFH